MPKYKMLVFLAVLAVMFYAAVSAGNIREAESRDELPVVGSAGTVKELLGKKNFDFRNFFRMREPLQEGMENTAGDAVQETKSEAPASDYSTTNTQVQGVDESDIVKTDGKYIYQVAGEVLKITRAYPAEEMKSIKTLEFNDENFSPREIYVDGQNLVVIGESWWRGLWPMEQSSPEVKAKSPEIYYPGGNMQSAKVLVYDISNMNDINLDRDLELDGYYLTSRKVDNNVYVISNKNIFYDNITKPRYFDSEAGSSAKEIDFDEIHYFPDSDYYPPNYMLVSSIDLNSGEPAVVDAYLGTGDNVYMSKSNLYVAVSERYCDTSIYKFNVKGNSVDYQAQGKVSGTILNQFSMDEHEKHFRIATTDYRRQDTNNLYVLDKDMEITGKIEDIAPGERIYSARFTGDKGYLVTFEQVDPLFVVDLSDPGSPRILGKLKIPGFSNYLHPLDESHILGIGKDTELEKTGQNQRVIEKGMKLAIFDVSDYNNPREKHVEIIGGRGTHSEVLHNHKALFFDKKNNLLAFPVNIINDHRGFDFQGALVYKTDLAEGFKLQGKITHLSKDDYLKSGYWGPGEDRKVRRVIYIEEILYAVSNGKITAHDKQDIKHVKTADI